jgi:site-specific DNA recombinase
VRTKVAAFHILVQPPVFPGENDQGDQAITFCAHTFPKRQQGKRFDRNPFVDVKNAQSGWSRFVLVVPGCGGVRQGQNRDNSHSAPINPGRPTPFIPSKPKGKVRIWIVVRSRFRGRRGHRPSAEVEAERRQLRETTDRELDDLVAEFHRILPRSEADSVGMAYARYSSEFQHSVVDQVRAIFESAIKFKIFIPRVLVFFDIAITGRKERRAGLQRVRDTLATRGAQALLVFTTNRLYRKGYKCMRFVEEEAVGRGLRCFFVRTGVDTETTESWRLPLQLHTMIDEATSTMNAENIRAAHEGLFLKRMVVSTLPFGYTGQDIDGLKTKRGLDRQIIVIDEETAGWVRQIFHWFVVDRLPQARILERLNDQAVPCGPRCDGTFWSQPALHYLLSNPCYRGLWAYGRGQNVRQNVADYVKRVLRDKPLHEAQFGELRLVSDEVWYRVQELLAESPQKNAGRKTRDGNTAKRPRILNGLLKCETHGCGSVSERERDGPHDSARGWRQGPRQPGHADRP